MSFETDFGTTFTSSRWAPASHSSGEHSYRPSNAAPACAMLVGNMCHVPRPHPLAPPPSKETPATSTAPAATSPKNVNFFNVEKQNPMIFSSADASLIWVNSRPYRFVGSLGSGAFGTVYKVELLTPLGYTVDCVAGVNYPRFHDGDTVCLRPMACQELQPIFPGCADPQVALQNFRAAEKTEAEASSSNRLVTHADFLNPSGWCCALKKVAVQSDFAWQRCLEEVRLMEALRDDKESSDSEKIIRIYDKSLCEKKKEIVIIMELGEQDFAAYLKEGRSPNKLPALDAEEIFYWWREMMAAVTVAHAQGIVHCDLKPSNFILVKTPVKPAEAGTTTSAAPVVPSCRGSSSSYEEYTLKLSDFGVSRQLSGQDTHLSEDGSLGTVRYMAPEMVHNFRSDGKLRFGKPVDIWSVGVILHQVLHFQNCTQP